MVGTLFLFMYWPSFNGVLAYGMAQQRAAINTVFSISASALVSVYVSRVYLGKIDMEVLLNSTLAGGVMMGAAADIITGPGYCMIAGAIAGAISAFGYIKMNIFCQKRFGLHDTCGVQFLHGIPGFLGSIVCVIAIASAGINFENDVQTNDLFLGISEKGRTVQVQALYNLAGIAVTLAICIPTGLLFGFIASRLPMPVTQFDDAVNFAHIEYGDDTGKYNENDTTVENKV
jgi:ammonium transporter Rh